MTTDHHGPYTRREQAAADAAALAAAIEAADPGGPMTEQIRANRRQAAVTHIDNLLRKHGVERGAYDIDIEDWLSMWELETIQVILSWVERAHRAGARRAQTAATYRVGDQVVTPDGPGHVHSTGTGVVTVTLDDPDGRTRSYPDTFLRPHEGGAV
jgi:hypothetical protein